MAEDENKVNPLNIKSLSEMNAVGIAEQLKLNLFKRDWIFDKPYEKIILVILVAWSFYNLWRLII